MIVIAHFEWLQRIYDNKNTLILNVCACIFFFDHFLLFGYNNRNGTNQMWTLAKREKQIIDTKCLISLTKMFAYNVCAFFLVTGNQGKIWLAKSYNCRVDACADAHVQNRPYATARNEWITHLMLSFNDITEKKTSNNNNTKMP